MLLPLASVDVTQNVYCMLPRLPAVAAAVGSRSLVVVDLF